MLQQPDRRSEGRACGKLCQIDTQPDDALRALVATLLYVVGNIDDRAQVERNVRPK